MSKTNIFFSRFEGTRKEEKPNISHLTEFKKSCEIFFQIFVAFSEYLNLNVMSPVTIWQAS